MSHNKVGVAILLLMIGRLAMAADSDNPSDPYLWLEDISSAASMQWVHEQNARTLKQIESSPDFEPIRKRILEILNSSERIPYVAKHGPYYYNFWQDPTHVRGLWRRTTLDEYKKPQPVWETVLDLDALAAAEKENWVWEGADVLKPDYDRCLISLSRGGADAAVVREFDLNSKTFVAGGFFLPEAKSNFAWGDRDHLYVATDFGPGSMTASGYPRIVKEWRRGTPLESAVTLFSGKSDDVGVGPMAIRNHGRSYDLINRLVRFFSGQIYLRRGDDWLLIDKPDDADLDIYGDYVVLRPKSDWTVGGKTYPAGSLLAENFNDYLAGRRQMIRVFTPGPRTSLDSYDATKNYLLLNEMEDVSSRLRLVRLRDDWKSTPVAVPSFGVAHAYGLDEDESDEYFLTLENFLTPTHLYLGQAGTESREPLKALPDFFDARGFEVTQHEAVSADGTQIPYFQVSPKGMKLDGSNPTILYGYGGFEVAMQPTYRAQLGVWLDRGGVYVLANIRGGGEFGPPWHDAARKQNRQRAYDDLEAVAEDLIARHVTSPRHLGMQGRSNGGLLAGVMLTQRPDLFGAVDCGSPLLDMRRYTKLPAGASWVDEYGDPDKPDDWAYIRKYSPYQNVVKDRKYPPVLFTTSTRDDRVHPGHARKMAALMEAQGHDVFYYENIEGGHGAAANNQQIAFMNALSYTFLLMELR